jgi:hypothetical protein
LKAPDRDEDGQDNGDGEAEEESSPERSPCVSRSPLRRAQEDREVMADHNEANRDRNPRRKEADDPVQTGDEEGACEDNQNEKPGSPSAAFPPSSVLFDFGVARPRVQELFIERLPAPKQTHA